MSTPTAISEKKYHHGDLRNALIVAAAEIIEESSSIDFTMSMAAKRAGVSIAAPYRHFKDKESLLEAVRELCFYGLSSSIETVRETQSEGTRECIIAIGQTYIRYLEKNAAFYPLMWGEASKILVTAERDTLNASGFHYLVSDLQLWCETQHIKRYNATELAVKLWAIAHGLAVLALSGHMGQFITADAYQLLDSSAQTFLDGLLIGNSDG